MPFAVFDGKELIDYGILKVEGKYLEDKLASASENLTNAIEEYKIDVIVLEDVFYYKNFTSTKNTLMMLGALRLSAYKKNVVCYTVQATKWRKGVIKQRQNTAVKEQAVDYVNEMYDLSLEYHKSRTKTDDDIEEAIIMVEGLVWQRYTLEKFRYFKDKIGEKRRNENN